MAGTQRRSNGSRGLRGFSGQGDSVVFTLLRLLPTSLRTAPTLRPVLRASYFTLVRSRLSQRGCRPLPRLRPAGPLRRTRDHFWRTANGTHAFTIKEDRPVAWHRSSDFGACGLLAETRMEGRQWSGPQLRSGFCRRQGVCGCRHERTASHRCGSAAAQAGDMHGVERLAASDERVVQLWCTRCRQPTRPVQL